MIVGFSALHARRHDAEELLGVVLAGLPGVAAIGCTHLVDPPWRHEAVSVSVPDSDAGALVFVAGGLPAEVSVGGDLVAGPEAGRAGAAQAAAEHLARTGGRAVRYPGQDLLVGDVPVVEVLARTAIGAVVSSHGGYAPDAVLATGGFIRPRWEGGVLTVHVGHNDPRRLIPWEVPNPTPCCGADH